MNPRTVLIVDDSLTVRMDLADAFSAAGFHALSCATAADARETLSRERVDAIILDVLLPDANGVDVLNEIRSSPDGSAVSIVMLSSEAEIKDRIRGLRTGADEYVGKPYDVGYLVSRIEDLVRERMPPDGTTLLVIDDSPTFRDVLGQALQRSGYTVLTAPTGEEGLRIAGARRPGGIVVDGVLPGMDGPTVIRRVRLDAVLRDVPCLLLTGSEGKHAELRALDAGADAFVRKEEDLDVILARLAAMLRRAPARPLRADETKSLIGFRRVLAVDDSPTYLHGLADALKDEGYDVILARSGEEALDMLAVQPVDCILLDLMMPGLSGQETCERIKTAPTVRDTPLIMLTALEDREAMIHALSAGADDYISKASELEVLKARVRAQIRRKQFEDENRRIREELLRKELEAAEARAARELAETRSMLIEELERKNKELEAFSYSVSHDLRAPLRAIDGFSRIVVEKYCADLDPKGRDYLQRVCTAAQRMGELIDDLLELSRVGRAELHRAPVNLTQLARTVFADLQKRSERTVDLVVQEDLEADVDRRLMQVVLENLLGNSWKFTEHVPDARIELGREQNGQDSIYFVRDNGAGFDMTYAEKLFRPFQRLHSDAEFAGSGVGLATVYRVIERHGGRVWAEGAVGRGATVFFTLPAARFGHGGSL
jgi:two-component system NtrC family sensor kinase